MTAAIRIEFCGSEDKLFVEKNLNPYSILKCNKTQKWPSRNGILTKKHIFPLASLE